MAEQNGRTFSNEQVIHSDSVEGLGDFLRLERIEWLAVVHSAGAGWKPS